MFDPTKLTIGELASSLRDLGFFVTLCIGGWKARALVQPAIDFFQDARQFMKRGNKHMLKMETSMNMLLTNHLSHLKNKDIEIVEATEEIESEVEV
jgi:hypothetical protein